MVYVSKLLNKFHQGKTGTVCENSNTVNALL